MCLSIKINLSLKMSLKMLSFLMNFAKILHLFLNNSVFLRNFCIIFSRNFRILFSRNVYNFSRNFRDFYIAKQIEAKFCEKNENIHVFRADWYWTGNTSTQQYRDFYQMHHFFQFFKIIWSQCLPRQLGSWPKLLKLW